MPLGIFLKGYISNFSYKNDTKISNKDAKSMGLSFLFHNLTLIFAVNGEQLLINIFDVQQVSAHLYKYFVIFTPIAFSVNGFLGFYLAPKIRKQNSMSIVGFKKLTKRIFIFTLPIIVLSVSFGIAYFKIILDIDFFNLDHNLIIVFVLLAIIRGVYIVCSVCLGVFGNLKHLKMAAIYTWIFTVLYIVSVIIILLYADINNMAFLIAFATMINWLFRLIVSNYFSRKAILKLSN